MQLKYERERPTIEIPDGFFMVQDTREQLPIFKPAEWIVNKGLKTGDYSVVGMEELVTIERKSIHDLFGTLGKGRRRFENELKRMKKTMKWFGMMIEGCEDKVMRKQEYSTMVVNQIYHAVSSFEIQGLHIYYAKTKDDARDWIVSRLTRFYVHARRGDME